MNMFEAAVALVKAGEQNAEAVAHAFVTEVQAHLEGLIAGMDARITALETKVATDAANGLASLGDRMTALEKAGGLTVSDDAVTAAIAGLTATPPAPAPAQSTSADAPTPQPAAATTVADPAAAGDAPAAA